MKIIVERLFEHCGYRVPICFQVMKMQLIDLDFFWRKLREVQYWWPFAKEVEDLALASDVVRRLEFDFGGRSRLGGDFIGVFNIRDVWVFFFCFFCSAYIRHPYLLFSLGSECAMRNMWKLKLSFLWNLNNPIYQHNQQQP